MKKQDDLYILEIEDRIRRIRAHIKGLSRRRFLESNLHQSAAIRELEVIGEAARMVSPETQALFPSIPWRQIVATRNRLIHEYFDVDHELLWEVIQFELPKLEKEFPALLVATSPKVHPWRSCPSGFYFVRSHPRQVKKSGKNPSGKTQVESHCRRNPTGKDQLYPDEILEMTQNVLPKVSSLGKVGQLRQPSTANNFDSEILIWVKYWNEIFKPDLSLDPNVVKALLGSESSFSLSVKDVKIRDGNFARGLFQISDETRKILADERGEIKDHFLTLTAKDVKNPVIGASASIRWLFHKRDLASKYLKRSATWEEGVAHYKGYLRKKGDPLEKKGMKRFRELLQELRKATP